MDENPTPVPLSWPAPPPQPSSLRKVPRRALTVTLATAALVVAGGAVLAAAAQNTTTNPSPTPAGQMAPGQMAPGPMGQNDNGRRMTGPMKALHGEYVVSNGNGGYQTEEMQRGSVTAINGTTFTVKSDDGYTHDWVTDATTRMGGEKRMRMMPKNNNGTTEVPAPTTTTNNGLTTGQNVMVMGIKDGDTFHAVRVMPMRQPGPKQQVPNGNQGAQKMPYRGEGRGQFGPRGGQGGGMQGFGGMQNGHMQSGPTQSAPSPEQQPVAPVAAPTPTRAS
jgi:hypothetical protein